MCLIISNAWTMSQESFGQEMEEWIKRGERGPAIGEMKKCEHKRQVERSVLSSGTVRGSEF